MHTTIVNVHVKKEHIEDFIKATRLNHEASKKEPGNRRFDVLQSPDDSSQFILYEAYVDRDEAAKHKETEHYLVWRAQVEPWMEVPRKFSVYKGLFPDS